MAEDTRGPEKVQAFGTAALTQTLSDVDFPKSKDDLLKEFGDKTFQLEKGKEATVRDILQDCHHERFETMADVLSCEEIQQNIKAA